MTTKKYNNKSGRQTGRRIVLRAGGVADFVEWPVLGTSQSSSPNATKPGIMTMQDLSRPNKAIAYVIITGPRE